MKYRLEKIEPAIEKMYKINIKAKKNEQILVINDYLEKENYRKFDNRKLIEITERALIARKIAEIGNKLNYNVKLNLYPVTLGEPPNYIADAMKESDVVIAPTTYSISHTKATKETVENKGRVVSMPSVTFNMFLPRGSISADYEEVAKITKKICDMGENSKYATIIAPRTKLSFEIGRKWLNDDGIFELGEFGNLPAGESATAPTEGMTEGYCTIPIGWGSKNLTSNMKVEIKHGHIASIKGGGEKGDEIRKAINNDSRRVIAEFAVGGNKNARNKYKTLEAEKMLGTAHIAFGDNTVLGGNNRSNIHVDLVIPDVTVYLDETMILKKGKLLI